jgi:outer membrane protein assembly factor BamB
LDKILWEHETFSKIKTQPLVIENNILIGNLSGTFYSLDLADGTENWKLLLGGVFNSTPLAFRNLLIQPDLNKKVYMIDHRSGEVVNELFFESRVRMSPAYYRGKIYFGADRGDIYSYRIIPR